MIQLTSQEFHIMETYIRKKYGINLENKQYLIESKLWSELIRYGLESYGEYWQKLRADGTGEMERRMMDLLTTNYTYFCREERHFEFLRKQILPYFYGSVFRIWCAGCATGQECYTLAMYLLDCQAMGMVRTPVQIIGTDLAESAIETARRGVYGSGDFERLPQRWKDVYCERLEAGAFRIRPQVHRMVTFRRQNLLDPPERAGHYSLIFCRNVLIYFREEERRRLVERLTRELAPGGYLFIGHTESLLGCENDLTYIQPAIYRKPEKSHGEK